MPGDYHWDGKHYSGGIAQWDSPRAAAIKAKFGDVPWKLSVADQVRASIWEYRTNPRFASTKRAMEGDNAADMIGALVDNYEDPANKAKAKAQRMGYYRGFNPGGAKPAPEAIASNDNAQTIGDLQANLAKAAETAGVTTSTVTTPGMPAAPGALPGYSYSPGAASGLDSVDPAAAGVGYGISAPPVPVIAIRLVAF